jgi:hypothetical protein
MNKYNFYLMIVISILWKIADLMIIFQEMNGTYDFVVLTLI